MSTFILAHPPLDRQSISLVAAFATTEDEKEAIFASLPLPAVTGVYFRYYLDPHQGQTGPVSWEVAPLPPQPARPYV